MREQKESDEQTYISPPSCNGLGERIDKALLSQRYATWQADDRYECLDLASGQDFDLRSLFYSSVSPMSLEKTLKTSVWHSSLMINPLLVYGYFDLAISSLLCSSKRVAPK